MGGSEILVLGDSWADFSDQAFATYCQSSRVVNIGIGGSRADQWAGAGTYTSMIPTAFQDIKAAGRTFSHVWMSLGGNDALFNANCGAAITPTIPQRLGAVITHIINSAAAQGNTHVKVIITGYCMPTGPAGGCTTVSSAATWLDPVNGAFAGTFAAFEVSHPGRVIYADIHTTCGGTQSAWSPAGMHIDLIHISNKGCTPASAL